MKILRLILLILVIVAVALVGFIFLQQRLTAPRLQSATILESIETLSQFETTEYFYQFVFPYDFGIDDNTMLLIEQGQLSLDTLPQEAQETYSLSTKTGLRKGGKTNFIVLGMRIRAGIELENITTNALVTATMEETALRITLPYPEIQSIVALDIQEPYNYPAVPLDANELRMVTSFVKERAATKAVEDNILEECAKALRSVLSGWLKSMIDKEIIVEFTPDTP